MAGDGAGRIGTTPSAGVGGRERLMTIFFDPSGVATGGVIVGGDMTDGVALMVKPAAAPNALLEVLSFKVTGRVGLVS